MDQVFDLTLTHCPSIPAQWGSSVHRGRSSSLMAELHSGRMSFDPQRHNEEVVPAGSACPLSTSRLFLVEPET